MADDTCHAAAGPQNGDMWERGARREHLATFVWPREPGHEVIPAIAVFFLMQPGMLFKNYRISSGISHS